MKTDFICRLKAGLFFLLCVTGIVTTVSGQGIMFSALGPVNRGMAGASVAAPVDAIGSLHWNPAAISGLGSSELSAGLELILPNIDATSFSPAPGLGGAGTTGAEPGVIPSPSVGWVHQSLTNPRLTYGLGIYSIAGFQTNYPSDPGNPVLNPALFGRVFTSAEFLQIVPTMSYAVSERLSIGFAPTLTMGRIEVSPFVLAPPVPPVPGAPYSSGQGNRWHWGGGAQLGLYYIADNCWHLGASIKSPQWFEKFRFHSENPDGTPRVVSTELELPMIISVGAAYSGYENLILAMDVRYFGYEDTKLFGDAAAFAANGQLLGLGWNDVFSVALGAQYRLNDCTYVRAGYSYNTNPVGSANAGINVATPLIYEHVVNFGMSRQITDCVALNLSFTHAVDNTVSGPLVTPVGVLGGISHSLSVYTVAMGATVRY